jgi:hypothetical protein
MKKLIGTIVLILLLTTAALLPAGCDQESEETEIIPSESNRWLELLKVLPENEETLKGVILQDIAYLDEKKQQLPQITDDYEIIGNLPELFGSSPHAYNDEEWKETLGFVRSDVDRTIIGDMVPPHHYVAVQGRFDRDEIDKAVKTSPMNEMLEVVSYHGYEYYSWGEDNQVNMTMRSNVRPLGRGHRLALVDDFAFWVIWTEGVEEMIDSYEGNIKSVADNEDFIKLAGVLEEFDTVTAYFSNETQAYSNYSEVLKQITEDPDSNEANKIYAEEIKREPRLKPYQAFATGAGLDDKGYYLVIAILNPDEETAKQNAGLLEERLNNARLPWGEPAGIPWSEVTEDMEIEASGRLTIAQLYGQACVNWDNFSINLGSLPLLIHE